MSATSTPTTPQPRPPFFDGGGVDAPPPPPERPPDPPVPPPVDAVLPGGFEPAEVRDFDWLPLSGFVRPCEPVEGFAVLPLSSFDPVPAVPVRVAVDFEVSAFEVSAFKVSELAAAAFVSFDPAAPEALAVAVGGTAVALPCPLSVEVSAAVFPAVPDVSPGAAFTSSALRSITGRLRSGRRLPVPFR
ncbi:hypothetical protein HW532_05720 [Kaustia mangrovi]|uniref:Uncharacterized protein n=1 Tax=Kaustia mangrovi TaxID=2593653 RepID=A0A7S8C2L3_9HYPH|nr:hypothetical protein [Kaustia mangrovi]QPC42244.1 hypothetical protein HW532_05720 [Kaustia mangrovi]